MNSFDNGSVPEPVAYENTPEELAAVRALVEKHGGVDTPTVLAMLGYA
jgi:hypothetical protein